jgi:hypothetical protein
MRIQNIMVLSVAVALIMTSAAPAQRRTVPASPGEVGAAVTLQVAGQPYHFEGSTLCQYAPVASIYNLVGARWSVRQSDGQRSIRLTLWRPRSGSGDMFSLTVANHGKNYLVNTVTLSRESAVRGSGKVTFTTSGAGGTFMINGKAANGAAITGTIQCSAFTNATAEGGD